MRGKFKKDYWIIKFSGLFDPAYYLRQYADVRHADVDPLEHFVLHGWKEGRNPNEWFNTREYLEKNPDVARAGINPFVHWIERSIRKLAVKAINEPRTFLKFLSLYKNVGFKNSLRLAFEKINVSEVNSNKSEYRKFKKFFCDFWNAPKLDSSIVIDIIIPVYNGREYLTKCLETVYRNTSINYRLLICDDCSTDTEIQSVIKNFEDKFKTNVFCKEFISVRNERNLGFVRTVNRMYKQFVKNHFVILNTDVLVPPNWLERLVFPILENPKIASTTPFTNACTIFSFPEMNKDNELFKELTVEEIDSYFKKVCFDLIQVPTGGGFCMGINKEVTDRLGLFDEVYGKGYGEENDFCMRAYKEGYINILVPNLFVYHKHGASFPTKEKQALMRRNLEILFNRYPEYPFLVDKFIKEDPAKDIRYIVKFAILSYLNGCTLIIDHGLGGGATYYAKYLFNSYPLSILVELNTKKITMNGNEINTEIFSYEDFEHHEIIQYIAKHFKINKIVVNNIVGIEDIISLLEGLKNIKILRKELFLEYKVHDFYAVCPVYVLLNQNLEFCGIPEDLSQCIKCLRENPIKEELITNQACFNVDLFLYRKKWKEFFELVDIIECFSESSKDIILKVYPETYNKVVVNPHKVKWVRKVSIKKDYKLDNNIKIAVIGAINTAKGGHVVFSIAEYLTKNNIRNVELHLYGEIMAKYMHPRIIYHGKYEREKLSELMEEEGIDIILIPSVWPETFSYTTEEAILMDLPVAVFNIGAPVERVKHYEKGLIIYDKNPEKIIKAIQEHLINLNQS